MILKLKSGDRNLKKFPKIVELFNSIEIQNVRIEPELLAKYKAGDTSKEVLDYIKSEFRPWKHVELNLEQIQLINKELGRIVITTQYVPVSIDIKTNDYFIIIPKIQK